METALLFIMLLVTLCFVLRLTFMRPVVMVAEAVVAAIVTILMTDTAASMSKTRIEAWIGSPDLMLDMAVILTIDVGLQIAFCVSAVSQDFGRWAHMLRRILNLLPGVMIYPVMLYALASLFFSLPGVDFKAAGYATGAGIALLFPLMAAVVKYLLSEREIRLELVFYTACIIALLGIVATVNGRTATTGINELNLSALCAITAIGAAGCVTGFIWYKHKTQ